MFRVFSWWKGVQAQGVSDFHPTTASISDSVASGSIPEPRTPSPTTGEMADTNSYFPRSHRSSVSSGTSSALEAPSSAQRPTEITLTPTPSTSTAPVSSPSSRQKDRPADPLTREYPAPPEHINLDEMLARKPGKWSLRHYIDEASTRNASPHHEDKQKAAEALAATKKELLQAKEELGKLSFK